ncbi:unnamed protein product [Diamesa serratosioi]
MKWLKSLMTLSLVFWMTVNCEEIPDFLLVCHKGDPNLNQCVSNSVNNIKPYLVRGIPEYDIPGLEPILLGDLIVAESTGNNGQGLSITANDIKTYGTSDFVMTNMKVEEYARHYTFKLEFPNLFVVGRYKVDGRILFLPIKGSGKFTGNFTGVLSDVSVKGIQQQINGQTKFIVNKLQIKLTVKDGNLDLENLFGGDKTLGEIINQTINQNFAVFSKELIPLIEKSLSRVFKRTANKILERFTMAQLFPQ